MRESIGGTWTLQIVIVFILFFVAFITLTLNYTRAFRIRNEIINIIEREEGFTTNADTTAHGVGAEYLIAAYLRGNNYTTTGRCDRGWVGVYDLSLETNGNLEMVENPRNREYYYCLRKVSNPVKGVPNPDEYNYNNRAFYQVKAFFKFNLPVVGEITTFSVKGETIDIYFNMDQLDGIAGSRVDADTAYGVN